MATSPAGLGAVCRDRHPLNLVDFRRNQLTKPLFKLYKSIMPEMSRTEKEAIEAGTTWWEADLFAGNPNWKKLHAIPVSTLSAEEQAFMDGPVEEVCRMVNDWEVTHERADLSPEVWQYLKDHKFFAMIIKKKYGGLEFSAYAQSCVLQSCAAPAPCWPPPSAYPTRWARASCCNTMAPTSRRITTCPVWRSARRSLLRPHQSGSGF